MVAIRDRLVSNVAARDKYSLLHRHFLSILPKLEWLTTFQELEAILGAFALYVRASVEPNRWIL